MRETPPTTPPMTAFILSFLERFPDLGIGDKLVSGAEATLEVAGVLDRFGFVEVIVDNDTSFELGGTGLVVFMGEGCADFVDSAVSGVGVALNEEQSTAVESGFEGQKAVSGGYALEKSELDVDMDGAGEAVGVDGVEVSMSLPVVQSVGTQSDVDSEDKGVVEELEEEL